MVEQKVAYHLSAEELRQVQMIELEILLEIDRICKKFGIKYCIIAGTLLGAVRHGGFIPWDDDVDIALLRPEYEKFRLACETELDTERFYFQDHRNTPGYRWGYGKVRRKDTKFVRLNQEHMPYEQGVFIDVFPLDNVPDGKIVRTIRNFQCFLYRKAFWSAVGCFAEKNKFKRFVYHLLYKIPEQKLYAHFDNFVKKCNHNQTKWVRILTFPTPNKEYGYLRRWYENLASFSFEGQSFPGIRDYDEYLSFKFGDYMQLPPKDRRKVHLVSEVMLLGNCFLKNNISEDKKLRSKV
ncbi:MAG: LicD family protein [Peptococcaceae bacterium]|nr:LicD family protein [Peptococcaceae bacterium]